MPAPVLASLCPPGDEDRFTWIGQRVWAVGADGKRRRGSIVSISDHPSAAPTVVICVDGDRAVIVFRVASRETDWGFVDP